MTKYAKIIATTAAATFAQFPDLQVLHVTEDGNAFMPHAENLAINHANMQKLPRPIMVKREEVREEVVASEIELAKAKAGKEKKVAPVVKPSEEVAVAPNAPAAEEPAADANTGDATDEATDEGEEVATNSEGAQDAEAMMATLKSSEVQPDKMKIKGQKWTLQEIVAKSFQESGMNAEQWNDQPQEDREAAIELTIEGLKA